MIAHPLFRVLYRYPSNIFLLIELDRCGGFPEMEDEVTYIEVRPAFDHHLQTTIGSNELGLTLSFGGQACQVQIPWSSIRKMLAIDPTTEEPLVDLTYPPSQDQSPSSSEDEDPLVVDFMSDE